MDNRYLEVISYLERLHRQFLEVVKLELEGLRIHDINNVQAMMLFNIGDAENDSRRTHTARVLSRLKCLVQRKEDGGERISRA